MAVSELPGNPNAVWTVKRNTEGELVKWWSRCSCVSYSLDIYSGSIWQ